MEGRGRVEGTQPTHLLLGGVFWEVQRRVEGGTRKRAVVGVEGGLVPVCRVQVRDGPGAPSRAVEGAQGRGLRSDMPSREGGAANALGS